ncbi:MAG TPA: hypothetical protein VIN60_10625 [Anaerolineales bacterium]
MKAFSFISKISKKGLLIATGALVVLGSIFSVPTNVVFAAPATPASYTALMKAYKDDQNWLKTQENNLDRANTVVTQVQALITAAKSDGIGANGLSAALAVFQTQLRTAKSSHATASAVLSAHKGFDNSGNVTNPVLAAQTVKDATQSLTDAHNVLVQSSSDLLRALKLWSAYNHITSSSPVYSAYNQAYQATLTLHNAVTGEH